MKSTIKERQFKYFIDYNTCISDNNVAKIYRGQNRQTSLKIVLKQIDIKKCKSYEEAIMEGSLLKQLNHPNIIKLLDIQINPKVYRMYLQYATHNLKSFTSKEKKLPKDTILNWCKQLVQAMIYLHQRKILHLDLKPQNIMLMANYTLRIIDFGQSLKGIRVKMAKDIKATPSYCPPYILHLTNGEQMIQFDQSFDVWSFGTILYQLITGKILFDGTNKIKIKNQMKKFQTCWQQILSPQKIKQKIFRDILQKTLRIKKQQRISFYEIKQMIEKQSKPSKNNYNNFDNFQQIQKTKIIPTMQIENFQSQDYSQKTQRSFFNSINKIDQSKIASIRVAKYIQYYEFLISEVNLLIKKINLDSDQNGLIKVLNNYELAVIKICLSALTYKFHTKLNEIVKQDMVQLPSGEIINFKDLHKMINQQKIRPILKRISQKYIEWNNNNQKDTANQKNVSLIFSYIKNNPNQQKMFPQNSHIVQYIFQYPNKFISYHLKRHVLQLQNIKFKQEVDQFMRLKIQPIARRDIYFCSMIASINRILPQNQYQSTELKKYYNDLKDLKGDQLIKECLKNVIYNLN